MSSVKEGNNNVNNNNNNNNLSELMSITDYLCEKRYNDEFSADAEAEDIPPARCSSAPVSETASTSSQQHCHRRFSSRIPFSSKRRLSSLVMGSILKKETSVTKEMKQQTPSETLHQIIRNSEKRSILISKLISQRSDCTIRVRLIAAGKLSTFLNKTMELTKQNTTVDEYERTQDRAQQRLKGFKIVSMFVSKESMFHICGIPVGLEQALLQFKLNKLVELRAHVLECMAQHDIVAKVMNDLACF